MRLQALGSLVHDHGFILPFAYRLFQFPLKEIIVKVLADKDHLGLTLLALAPVCIGRPKVNLFVHSLKNELRVTLATEGQHTLGSEEVFCLFLEKFCHELVEPNGIKLALDGEANRRHKAKIVALLLLRGRVIV